MPRPKVTATSGLGKQASHLLFCTSLVVVSGCLDLVVTGMVAPSRAVAPKPQMGWNCCLFSIAITTKGGIGTLEVSLAPVSP